MIVYFWTKRKVGQGMCLVVLGTGLLYGLWVFSRVVSGTVGTVQLVQTGQEARLAQQVGTKRIEGVRAPEGAFVASKKGRYYYPISCNRAKTLSTKNTLYFNDILAAEAAGYKPFSGC